MFGLGKKKDISVEDSLKDEVTILKQSSKMDKTGDMYSDLINGQYNHDGWEIYRVFRDINNKVIRIQFKKGGDFKVVNPGSLEYDCV